MNILQRSYIFSLLVAVRKVRENAKNDQFSYPQKQFLLRMPSILTFFNTSDVVIPMSGFNLYHYSHKTHCKSLGLAETALVLRILACLMDYIHIHIILCNNSC